MGIFSSRDKAEIAQAQKEAGAEARKERKDRKILAEATEADRVRRMQEKKEREALAEHFAKLAKRRKTD